jgi:hypothetical protein
MGTEFLSDAAVAGLIAVSSILAAAVAWLREALVAVRSGRRN